MEVIETITLEQIIAARPKTIYYGANTCWWTHDPKHLSTVGEIQGSGARGVSLPCDPRGGMLFETDDVAGFIAAARTKADAYGRHGLRAFMAAHHLNCIKSLDDPRPWCERGWGAYNEALDRLDLRKSVTGATAALPLGTSALVGVDRGAQPAVVNGAIHDFFLVVLDRVTGEQIGGAPGPRGTAHFKANLSPLYFVLSFVRGVVPDVPTFVRDLATDLARAYVADVYGRPEGAGEWELLAHGEQYVVFGGSPS